MPIHAIKSITCVILSISFLLFSLCVQSDETEHTLCIKGLLSLLNNGDFIAEIQRYHKQGDLHYNQLYQMYLTTNKEVERTFTITTAPSDMTAPFEPRGQNFVNYQLSTPHSTTTAHPPQSPRSRPLTPLLSPAAYHSEDSPQPSPASRPPSRAVSPFLYTDSAPPTPYYCIQSPCPSSPQKETHPPEKLYSGWCWQENHFRRMNDEDTLHTSPKLWFRIKPSPPLEDTESEKDNPVRIHCKSKTNTHQLYIVLSRHIEREFTIECHIYLDEAPFDNIKDIIDKDKEFPFLHHSLYNEKNIVRYIKSIESHYNPNNPTTLPFIHAFVGKGISSDVFTCFNYLRSIVFKRAHKLCQSQEEAIEVIANVRTNLWIMRIIGIEWLPTAYIYVPTHEGKFAIYGIQRHVAKEHFSDNFISDPHRSWEDKKKLVNDIINILERCDGRNPFNGDIAFTIDPNPSNFCLYKNRWVIADILPFLFTIDNQFTAANAYIINMDEKFHTHLKTLSTNPVKRNVFFLAMIYREYLKHKTTWELAQTHNKHHSKAKRLSEQWEDIYNYALSVLINLPQMQHELHVLESTVFASGAMNEHQDDYIVSMLEYLANGKQRVTDEYYQYTEQHLKDVTPRPRKYKREYSDVENIKPDDNCSASTPAKRKRPSLEGIMPPPSALPPLSRRPPDMKAEPCDPLTTNLFKLLDLHHKDNLSKLSQHLAKQINQSVAERQKKKEATLKKDSPVNPNNETQLQQSMHLAECGFISILESQLSLQLHTPCNDSHRFWSSFIYEAIQIDTNEMKHWCRDWVKYRIIEEQTTDYFDLAPRNIIMNLMNLLATITYRNQDFLIITTDENMIPKGEYYHWVIQVDDDGEYTEYKSIKIMEGAQAINEAIIKSSQVIILAYNRDSNNWFRLSPTMYQTPSPPQPSTSQQESSSCLPPIEFNETPILNALSQFFGESREQHIASQSSKTLYQQCRLNLENELLQYLIDLNAKQKRLFTNLEAFKKTFLPTHFEYEDSYFEKYDPLNPAPFHSRIIATLHFFMKHNIKKKMPKIGIENCKNYKRILIIHPCIDYTLTAPHERIALWVIGSTTNHDGLLIEKTFRYNCTIQDIAKDYSSNDSQYILSNIRVSREGKMYLNTSEKPNWIFDAVQPNK